MHGAKRWSFRGGIASGVSPNFRDRQAPDRDASHPTGYLPVEVGWRARTAARFRNADADSHAGLRVPSDSVFEHLLVLQVGVGSAVSASLARQIENAVDCPNRVEGAGVAALERHLARPVVVDPVVVA